jgi:D-galactarolactone cycloisomerase
MSVNELERMFQAGAIDICQPSVIKFGGIEAVVHAATRAKAYSIKYVPHCFYFGPGFLATLHLAAALASDHAFELFFGDLEASPYHEAIRAIDGKVNVPNGPGLGIEPDMKVIEKFRVGSPLIIEG